MRASVVALLLLLASCTGTSASSTTGLGEPIFVESGTFFPGGLPGTPAPDGGAIPDGGPQIPDLGTVNALVLAGQVGHNFSGHVTPDSYSVGVRFQDAGTGYWVVPADGPDPTDDNLLAWSFNAPLGLQNLQFVAIDGTGQAGEQQSLPTCVVPPYPDNYNVCYPTRKPPAVVVSLLWDSNADLDLVLRTPDGKWVDPKHPTTADNPDADAGFSEAPSTVGAIDRDSNAECVIDNLREEDATWTNAPTTGTYLIYANEFSACSTQASTFEIVTYRRVEDADAGTYSLAVTQTIGGQFLAQQANGNDEAPLYVTSISFP